MSCTKMLDCGHPCHGKFKIKWKHIICIGFRGEE